jgi:hypothetical protein
LATENGDFYKNMTQNMTFFIEKEQITGPIKQPCHVESKGHIDHTSDVTTVGTRKWGFYTPKI